ncbi:hypothetical protein WMF27_20365 [Sorangium sp. So ce281]
MTPRRRNRRRPRRVYLGAGDRGKLHGLLGSVNGLSLLVSLPYAVLAH